MSRGRRILLLASAGLAALVIAVAIVLPRLIDAAQYQRVIEQRVSSALGREVRIGAVALSLLPLIALRVVGLEVAGLPEEGGGNLLVADSLRVRAALLPLLRGRLEVGAVEVSGAKLHLVRDAGGAWNVARLLAERPAGGGASGERGARELEQPSRLTVDRLRFDDARVTIEDRSVSPPLELVLDPLDLELAGLAAGRLDLVIDARFGGASDARLRWSGAAGPMGAAGQPFALEGKAKIDRVAPELLVALARLGGLDLATLGERLGPVSGTVEVDAEFPEQATLRGELDLGKISIALPAAGEPRRVTLDVASRFDVASERGADLLRIATLEIETGEATLALDGTIESVGADTRRVDLDLHPVRLAADRLAALVAMMFPDAPFSFSAPQPLEVEARISGIVSPEQRPGIDGRVRIADLRLVHRALALPIEHLSADVVFSGESLSVKGLQAVLGDTDLRGELRVDGFSRPRARFDLASRRANLDQLFGALESDRAPASSGGRGDGGDNDGDDLLGRLEAEGHLRIEQATWGDVEGSDLDGTLRLEHGTVTLEPLTATLYSGRFDGRVDAWPARSPLPFRIQGSARDVRVEQFLAGALGIEDRLTGRFSGTVRADGTAGEWAEVARSLQGRGEMRIEDGAVESFPLLRSVASLSGVLGEDGLAKIASRLAESATRFSVLAGEFSLGGGAMRFQPIVLQSADYTLRGEGVVDLVQAALDGRGAMTFSAELSELMRAEDSRAAELFWSEASKGAGAGSDGAGRVSLPLSLRGMLSEPSALIDWESAAKGYAERRVSREVERQVGKILGRLLGAEPTPTPPRP